MTNSETFYFAGKCLALDENPEFRNEIIDKCIADLIDWQQFVALCSNHLILPAIYLKFHSHGVTEFLPEELLEHLSDIYQINVKRNSKILIQINEITNVLNKNNIYPVFLKGTGNLLDGLYSDIGERILGDIDFLVSEMDFMLSVQLMKNEGYSTLTEIPAYSDIKSLKHYPRLFHPDFEAVIEIHRIPVDEKYQSWFNTEIIDRKKVMVSSPSRCYVECDSHKIIHNFIHSQLSNEGNLLGIVSFRSIYDLYLLSKRFKLSETLSEIKTKQLAIAYFVFAGKSLCLPNELFPRSNLSSRILCIKHSLNLNSAAFYHTYRIMVFVFQRIFDRYLGQLIKSIYSNKMRQSIIRRIRDRNWYGDHLRLYERFFKKSK
jgi:hypothetical protein